MDQDERRLLRTTLIAIALITIIFGAVQAVSNAQINVTFNGSQAVRFNPIALFLGNQTVFPSDVVNTNFTNIMQINVIKNTGQISIVSTVTNTSQIFLSLTLTLIFNPANVTLNTTLNGLTSGTVLVTIPHGTYNLSLNLRYTALSTVTNQTGNWLITMTGH